MRLKNFKWSTGWTVVSYQILLFISLPFYILYAPKPSLTLLLISLFFYCAAMLSITAGYHRLYSHKCYKTNTFIELFLVFFGSMAAQRSILRWAYEHRIHHSFVDTDRDPYSIKKGFWYAHLWWLFEEPEEIDYKVVSDLTRNRLVMFQHKYENSFMFLSNLLPAVFVGWLLNDYAGAFVISLGARMFFVHHCTFFINSLAHTVGSQPYSKEHTAVNNYFISFPTFGEGFHNFHHSFPYDYRNGIRWFDFDPTKWFVWTLHKFRLAKDVKRVSKELLKQSLLNEKETSQEAEAPHGQELR